MENKRTRIAVTLVGMFIFANLYHMTLVWFETNTLQSPIVFRKPYRDRFISPVPSGITVTPLVSPKKAVVTPKVTLTPIPKKKALRGDIIGVVEASDIAVNYDDLFEKVRVLESGKGTAPAGHHRYCEGLGQWNEIGYGNRQGLCFADIAEGRLTLERWYTKRFNEGMTLAEALCYWESGHKEITSCIYAQRYFKL